jgi:uncharacterized membrane protein YqjE
MEETQTETQTEKQGFFEETQDLVAEYVNNRLKLLKLQAAEKSAKVVALIFTGFTMALIFFFVLLFLSMMAAYFIAEKTGSQFAGFGIVAGFYVVVFAVVILLRKKYDRYISDLVVRIFFDSTDDNETNETKN